MSLLKKIGSGLKKVVQTVASGVGSVLSLISPGTAAVTVGQAIGGVVKAVVPSNDRVSDAVKKTVDVLNTPIVAKTGAGDAKLYAIPQWMWFVVPVVLFFIIKRK